MQPLGAEVGSSESAGSTDDRAACGRDRSELEAELQVEKKKVQSLGSEIASLKTRMGHDRTELEAKLEAEREKVAAGRHLRPPTTT